jgi:crossover junction endodeoxyribonuclease RuvC
MHTNSNRDPGPGTRVPGPGARASCRILGIDPGSQRTGIGIVDADASGRCVHVHHVALRVLDAEDFPRRLKAILDGIGGLIETFRPDEVAIERVFMAKNPDSALKLGQARGAAICAAVLRDLPVHEYSPMQIKNAVVGRGAAEKSQVQHMIGVLLELPGKLQADAADALAVAITHGHSRTLAERTGVLASVLMRRRAPSRRR